VNRYVVTKAAERQLVLYWYQAHGRAVASEYRAKFFLVADAIRTNRTDGSLVRIATPIAAGEDSSAPEARAASFAEQIIPELDRFIPQ
jgi:EpsI family protein